MIGLPRGQNALSHCFDEHYKKEAIKIEKIKISLIHSMKAHRMLENFTMGVGGRSGLWGSHNNEKMGIEFQHAQ